MSNFKEEQKANLRDAAESLKDGKKEADSLMNEFKDKAYEVYEEGKEQMCDMQQSVAEHTDELVKMIKEKPMVSVLLAASAGYIFSRLFSKN